MALKDKVTIDPNIEGGGGGTFIVQANDPIGVPVEYPSGNQEGEPENQEDECDGNNGLILVIIARGKWKVNSLFKSECDADGYSLDDVKTEDVFHNYKAGRLLACIKWETLDDEIFKEYHSIDDNYYPIGTDCVLTIFRGQTLFFVCNDNNHEDNSGEIEVEWSVQYSSIT